MKAIIIGIDGATFDIILPMIRNGKLPNISRLIKNGIYSNLKSVFPPITFPAWTSMKTGKNPAKHGVFDFLYGIPYTTDNNQGISIGDVREKSFWKILSDNEYKVGVINVPATYPPEKINGVFISGFGTPSLNSEFTYPPEIKQILLDEQNFEFDIIEKRIIGKEQEFIKKLNSTTKKITNAIQYVLKNNKFDFLMVNYMAADQTQHFFYGYRDPKHPLYNPKKSQYGKVIEDIYSLIDDQIGIIQSNIPKNTNIFIVSDHGFGPYLKSVYLNEWLEQEGFLKQKSKNRNNSKIKQIKTGIGAKIITKIGPGFAKLLPRFLKKRAYSYIFWTKKVDWPKTKAYSGGFPGKIYINLKGREKEGIIKPGEEYNKLLNEIEGKLKSWKEPGTGERIVDAVYRKEEIYKGKYFDIAPDLMVIMKDMAYLNRPGFKNGNILYDPGQGGDHRLNGIFIGYGPDIKNHGKQIEEISICDIAPTILHMFDVPLENDFDGIVRKEIFSKDSSIIKRRIKYFEGKNEKEILKDQIKKLKINGKI
jgi:predicted AlkP superfamily phosphohydrolase/phosphomutase